MARIAIVTSHVTTGAAVSSDVVGMRAVLERHGHDARVYAETSDLQVPRIWPVNEVNDFLADPADMLIYHHSIGWSPVLEMLKTVKCRTVVKYHNITPPIFFSGVSAWHEQKCREGQEQLQAIADEDCDLYLSDSDYNQQELLAIGVDESKSFVVPPFHEVEQLHAMEADLKTLDAYRDGTTNVLTVSRVAPHKGHADLLKAFAAYHHACNRNSRLLIVGREEEAFVTYGARLRELIKFLSLEDAVIFAGEISDAAMRALYLLANVFVCTSEHEGFCLPLVEAMAAKVPAAAYDSAAISETLGGAGILLEDRNPEMMAESINALTNDEAMNVAVGIEGRRRYENQFTSHAIENKLMRALSTLNTENGKTNER